MPLSQLEHLREAVAAYLGARTEFEGVSVVTRKDGDIVNTIETEVAKIGVCAELFIRSAKPVPTQSGTTRLDPVSIGLTVYENVLLNQDPTTGTGKGAFYLIEEALVALKLWMPPGFNNVFLPDAAGPQYGRSDQQPTLLILEQDFTTILELAARTS